MVLHPVQQRNAGKREREAHAHCSSVQMGIAWPMTDDFGIIPKYRPSSESDDCQFMTKSSSSPSERQTCQAGSERPRPSRSRASPTSIPSTVMTSCFLQTVCPETASTRLSKSTLRGRYPPSARKVASGSGGLIATKSGTPNLLVHCSRYRPTGTLADSFHI